MTRRSLRVVQEGGAKAAPSAGAAALRVPRHWLHGRFLLQSVLFLIALGLVLHGFLGPQLAPRNLATLLAWVHYRGLVVLVLLFVGNLFCMACPLTVPREIARRFFVPRRTWPKKLRNKWLAVGLFVAILFAYELFDLWATPLWTAILIVGYWAAALWVDASFKDASFCKYLCPLGQFNFLSSTMSPGEIRVRNRSVCDECTTLDCIRGQFDPNGSGQLLRRGCELGLFQPKKVGNLDCTFCLDCVRACPKDNVAFGLRTPGEELWQSGARSGLGQLTRRKDLAALVVVFTFGALMNALGMVSPAYAFQRWMNELLGLDSAVIPLLVLFGLVMVLAPVLLLGVAAWSVKRSTESERSVTAIAVRFSYALLPLGFAVWLSHYCFHFLTGALTFIPVLQDVVAATGTAWLGEPQWRLSGLPEAVVLPLEVGFIALGVVGTLLAADRIAERDHERTRRQAFVPWAVVGVLLGAAGLWLLTQPMEMRGTFISG